ncbi:endonuclease III domain-containing protein [Mesorhizobium sp. ES1-4]|uniref:endonuclease III domain-containing protein n=1 Tax=Mesorhizobium sp. ES1-4 TaxID=2876627 RepID=UPI001CCE81B3|nr:endonuclease III domain-containing protein [Mesorhizobium sp. ES1-4]MBZ9799355.1 endonuclease III domain-containing protein [Mesorhizobium sp. ES1-4]
MQQVISLRDGKPVFLHLPEADAEVVPSVPWGNFAAVFTPAFWATQVWMETMNAQKSETGLGETLIEEVLACLLGGHGAPAEVGLAAYDRVRAYLQRNGTGLSLAEAEALLSEPLSVRGRTVRYRFAKQRARYLHGCLSGLSNLDEGSLADRELRDRLCHLPGVGPKTASWVVRNRRRSDNVAILDVHIIRACCHIGIFPANANPATDYFGLERKYLDFSSAAGVRASILDAVMWKIMRSVHPRLIQRLMNCQNRALVYSHQAGGER